MAERDPRVDPKAGDVLRTKNGMHPLRYVINVDTYSVRYARTRRAWRPSNSMTLRDERTPTNWRKWAKNAEVIHRAD